MGKSEVPQDASFYRLEQRIAHLEALLLHLDVRDITLVVHDWGGPVGLGFATRYPERIKRLVLLNTWAFAPWPGESFPRLLELIRSPRGEAFVLQKNGYLEPALLGTTFHADALTGPILQAYRAPFPTPESRVAMLWWSRDIPVAETDVSYAEMKRIEQALPLSFLQQCFGTGSVCILMHEPTRSRMPATFSRKMLMIALSSGLKRFYKPPHDTDS